MEENRIHVYCDGHGSFLYSIPQRPWEDNYPKSPVYCDECDESAKQGIKSPKMINFEWKSLIQYMISQRPIRLGEIGKRTIESFAECMAGALEYMPEPQQYESGTLERMTEKEWRNISLMKFEGYKQYCEKTGYCGEVDLDFLIDSFVFCNIVLQEISVDSIVITYQQMNPALFFAKALDKRFLILI